MAPSFESGHALPVCLGPELLVAPMLYGKIDVAANAEIDIAGKSTLAQTATLVWRLRYALGKPADALPEAEDAL